MLRLIIRILANSLAIYLADYYVSGVNLSGGWKLYLLCGFVLSIINVFIKPVIKFISLPLIFLTFGLFSLIINILVVWLLAYIIPQLTIVGLWAFIWTTVIVSFINFIVNFLNKKTTETT